MMNLFQPFVPANGKTVPVNELSRELKEENGRESKIDWTKKRNGVGVKDAIQPATGTLKTHSDWTLMDRNILNLLFLMFSVHIVQRISPKN
jgi:hypothetical protein